MYNFFKNFLGQFSNSEVQVYDTIADTWLPERNPFPVANVYGGGLFNYLGTLLLVCWQDSSVYEYDEANDAWIQKPGNIDSVYKEDKPPRSLLIDDSYINC